MIRYRQKRRNNEQAARMNLRLNSMQVVSLVLLIYADEMGSSGKNSQAKRRNPLMHGVVDCESNLSKAY